MIIQKFEIRTFSDKEEPSYIVSQLTGQKIAILLRRKDCPQFIFIKEYNATVNKGNIAHCEPWRKQTEVEFREFTPEEDKINKLFLAQNETSKLLNGK